MKKKLISAFVLLLVSAPLVFAAPSAVERAFPGTSAALKALISDATGTGALVFGTGPTLSSPVITPFKPTVVALSDGATPALDASLGNTFTLAAAGDRTIAVPSNASPGQVITIAHTASGGARTLALNTGAGGFRYGSDITGLTQTASGKTDYITCKYNNADSKWDVVAVVKGY